MYLLARGFSDLGSEDVLSGSLVGSLFVNGAGLDLFSGSGTVVLGSG